MQQNILKNSDITKIYFAYTDGKKNNRKENVQIRYMDTKSCYFVGPSIPNFSKPGWRAKAKIIVYTPEGVYQSEVIIRDITFTFQELMYKIDIPKIWSFKQLRTGTRKQVELPVKIKFSDGAEIETNTYDIAIGGVAIKSDKNLTTVHKSFPVECIISFPNDGYINFPDGKLIASAKYVRTKTEQIDELGNLEVYHIFKFMSISADQSLILKNYLLKLD